MPGFIVNGQGSGPSSTLETARRHRWKFLTLDPIKDILLFAHKSGRPGPEFDKVIMHHGQDQIQFPGKNKWASIDVSFYQVVGAKNDVAGAIYEWWSKSVVDISKSRISLIKRTCELQLLDGVGDAVYIYMMYGCYISKVKPDDLDYTSSAISEITFTLEMDKVIEKSGKDPLKTVINKDAGNSQNPAPAGYNASGNLMSGAINSADDIARRNVSTPAPFDAAAAAGMGMEAMIPGRKP